MRKRLIVLSARLAPGLFTALTTAFLTRLLDPAEYGLYAFGASITFFIGLAAFEWLGLSLIRMAPMAKQPEFLFDTIMACFGMLMLLLTIATVALLTVVGWLGNYAMFAIAILVATFASSWFELKIRLQLSELKERELFVTTVGRSVATAVFVGAAAALTKNASIMLLATGVAALLVGLLDREPRLGLFNSRFDAETGRSLLYFGLPLAISVGLATALLSIDKWMLQWLLGSHAVGLFAAATLLGYAPVAALASGVGPWAHSMAIRALEFESSKAADVQLARNFVVLIGIIVPGAAGIAALSSNLAHLLVGQAYWESAILLAPWLAGTAVLTGVRGFYVDTAFQLAHRTTPLIWTTLLAVIANILLDYYLIPVYGQLGAAIGSLSAVVVSLIAAAVVSRSVYRLPLPLGEATKVLACAAIMFVVLYAVRNFSGFAALAWQIPLGMAVYAGCLFILNVLGVRERIAPRFLFGANKV
jgi:O-antigen/teichoic acid export membrane protein